MGVLSFSPLFFRLAVPARRAVMAWVDAIGAFSCSSCPSAYPLWFEPGVVCLCSARARAVPVWIDLLATTLPAYQLVLTNRSRNLDWSTEQPLPTSSCRLVSFTGLPFAIVAVHHRAPLPLCAPPLASPAPSSRAFVGIVDYRSNIVASPASQASNLDSITNILTCPVPLSSARLIDYTITLTAPRISFAIIVVVTLTKQHSSHSPITNGSERGDRQPDRDLKSRTRDTKPSIFTVALSRRDWQ